ncbi:Transcriptional regulatory protein, C terminal [Prauserella marina]|uniref:Transcriptional regulatory protein, C terminal n=1 Tax=Prauserella marina TaxID=530584 RepID=A0A1G6RCG5_9PSEU|nr:BTAD domain-containing putative transcriptional regulator [Prauserella marina]PWV76985.1 transcriptional regulator [Prauserella marina]SDD01737.1 Transcriptional regulatory protein, C terminal [Prauserella marina]
MTERAHETLLARARAADGTAREGGISVGTVRFGLLGPLAVWNDDGVPVRVPEGKIRALLASLLLAEGNAVSAGRLADDLWGQDLPGNPVNTLQTKVSQLRRTLAGAALVHGPSGYALTVPADALDVARFRALVRKAKPGTDAAGRARVLSEALALWRGEPLADFAGEPFAIPFAAQLGEEKLGAREDLAEARLELGEGAAVVDELGTLVEEHPLRERVRALHLRALYQAGRQAEALRGYRDFRALLVGELGLEPGPELREVHAAMLRQDPVLRPSSERRPPLPVPLTELVGRDDAVRTVTGLLTTHRLVTLTGPGGVGKTRLATAAAAVVDTAPEASGGVWLVELAGIDRHSCAGESGANQGEWVLDAVASVLGVRDLPASPGVAERAGRLAEAVRGRDLLLVLDNCELVVESVAVVTAALVRAAPSLRVLATSRQPLGIAGELVWPVPPLGIPSGVHAEGEATESTVAAIREFSAVRLFAARAAEAVPGFALEPANAAAVAAICRRLDGLPLALELAATKLRALGIGEVLTRLDDRFRLLDSGHRDAPARQRTLRALIDWSWELLDEVERTVLSRLAVHAEGCDIAAAEAVCAAGGIGPADVAGCWPASSTGRWWSASTPGTGRDTACWSRSPSTASPSSTPVVN